MIMDYLEAKDFVKSYERYETRRGFEHIVRVVSTSMKMNEDDSILIQEIVKATKRREKLQKQLKECREYDEKLAHLALSRIELDLDDGVKKNYRKIQTANDGKFYEVLADSKNIMSKE